MIIESLRVRNFRCFGDPPVTITFDAKLTAIVGANGAGKTAVVAALQKLFGARQDERRLAREDIHFGPLEEPGLPEELEPSEGKTSRAAAAPAKKKEPPNGNGDSAKAEAPPSRVSTREIEIEVVLAFPELQEDFKAEEIPEVFRAMSAGGPGDPLKARIRLEATWTYGVEEDDISPRLYWITSLDAVPFGERDITKLPFAPGDRKRFQLRYLPATRDSTAILRQALRELLAWLERFGDWSSGRVSMATQWQELQALFDEMPAISVVTKELTANWATLFEGPHLRLPRLTVLAREIQRALRDLSLTLGPGPGGRHRSVHELSEGQASLFYIALAG
jgi:putative ATP-dependent endonuclease of the OLD family